MDKKQWETVVGPTSSDLAVCEAGGGDIIAEIVNGSVMDRDLIAAAPDLLKAASAYIEEYDHAKGGGFSSDRRAELRAAIAISRGTSTP